MIKTLRFAAIVAAAAPFLVAAQPVAEAQPPAHAASCIRMNQMQGSKLVNARTLYIRSSDRSIWRLDFSADCNDLGEPLVFRPVANSSSICKAIELDISVRGTGARCVASNLTRLTPEQADAIPPRDRP